MAARQTYKRWTAKELLLFEKLRLDGASTKFIAKQLNRSCASINGARLYHNLPRLSNKVETYLRLLMGPHSVKEVAKQLGVTREAVRAMKRRLAKKTGIRFGESLDGRIRGWGTSR